TWTDDNLLRQVVYERLREDNRPATCDGRRRGRKQSRGESMVKINVHGRAYEYAFVSPFVSRIYSLRHGLRSSYRITYSNTWKTMVPGEGFEPPTFGLQNRCTATVLTRLFNNLVPSRPSTNRELAPDWHPTFRVSAFWHPGPRRWPRPLRH